MQNLLTAAEIFGDFDANQPLEESVVKRTVTDGVVTECVYFTGRNFGEKKSRVYAELCYPDNSSAKSAILVINDRRKEIDHEDLIYWASYGFCAMAIDYRGYAEKGRFTLYPDVIEYANASAQTDDYYVANGVRNTKWYEYAINSMRAITYLKSLSFIKDVSVLTVGQGSRTGLIVLAMDGRIKKGSVVFGNLYEEYLQGRYSDDEEVMEVVAESDSKEEMEEVLHEDTLHKIWEIGLSPQSYVPLIKVPLYVVSGGNSGTVDVVKLSTTYFRANDSSRLLIVPKVMDYMTETCALNIVRWFEDKTVDDDLELSLTDSDVLTVRVNTSFPAEDIRVWYCRDASLKGKNWVKAPVSVSEDGTITAQLDVYATGKEVLALAYMYNHETIDITSPLLRIKVSDKYRLKTATRLVFDGSMMSGKLIAIGNGKHWHSNENRLVRAEGYLGITGVEGKRMLTFAVHDDFVTYRNCDSVSLDVCTEISGKLTLVATAEDGNRYTFEADLAGDGKWQKVTAEYSAFYNEHGEPMPAEQRPLSMAFLCDNKIIVNNIVLI